MKNVRSSQPCISMNFCTEFGKALVLLVLLKMQVCAGSVYTALQIVLPEKLINKILRDKQEKEENKLKLFLK